MASDTKYTWIKMGPDEVFEKGKHYYSLFYSPSNMGALAENPDVWDGGSLVGQCVRDRPSCHLPYYKRADEHQPPTKDTKPKDASPGETDPHGMDAHAPGAKLDAGKNRLDLVDVKAVEAMGWILTDGAVKYTENGWRSVPNARARYFAAMLRHAFAMWRGEKLDPQSGRPHSWHMLTNAHFIVALEED